MRVLSHPERSFGLDGVLKLARGPLFAPQEEEASDLSVFHEHYFICAKRLLGLAILGFRGIWEINFEIRGQGCR